VDVLTYDLVVIGSGPAGEKGAAQAAYFGKRVALVEREPFVGGAGVNTGTLPSKTLRETALILSGFRARGLYGVDLSLRRQATVQDFLHRERRVVDAERERVTTNLARHGVTVYRGVGSFVDPHVVKVAPRGSAPVFLRGEVILIATGSSPRRPAELPYHDPRVYDSETILTLQSMPRSMAVVGGGVIGCEYASMFAALGVAVHLVERGTVLLPFLDHEVSGALERRIADVGVNLALGETVAQCEPHPEHLLVTLSSGQRLGADAVLVAAGRTGNTKELELEAAGLNADKRGHISVDAHFRTAADHIYAAGDVVGSPALASTSMEQARLAMVHAFDLGYKEDLAAVLPYGIFTIPEVSMVGQTEQSLREAGVDFVVGRATYADNARGQIIGEHEGFLKLLFGRVDMRLLGVHCIGELASEVVHVGLVAVLLEASSEIFIRTCFNSPTLGELYKYATYDAMARR
jgi:NAD(P) transhydrogenase